MNINLTLLSVVGYCLCIAVVEHAALKDEETGPDKNIVYDRITFCYETLFECLQGSEVNFGCRTRCRDLEYNPALAHCEPDYHHCRGNHPVACHCPGDHKHRKAKLWPFNKFHWNQLQKE